MAPLLIVVVLSAVAAGGWWWSALERSGERSAGAKNVPATTVDAGPTTTIDASDFVRVDEVWLLDRGEGIYDWGVIVVAADPTLTRSGIAIDVRLVAENDEVVDTAFRVVDGVDIDSPGAAIGRVVDPATPPVRLEFDISVGVDSQDRALDELLEIRALSRSLDELNLRLRLVDDPARDAVGDVGVAFVWRVDGEVVAIAVDRVAGVRVGVDARVSVDLSDADVPDGLPDDVIWLP